jgi:1-acyl-sn-glycerol-3-phosphate acyltransferase
MMVFQHCDGLVGYPQGDSSREVSDLFFRGFATAAAAAAVVFFVLLPVLSLLAHSDAASVASPVLSA